MKKFIAIFLLFSFLFAVDANGEEREVEVLTGPEIKNREEVILYSSGEKKEERKEIDKDVEVEEEEAQEAFARVKARAEAEKEKEKNSFISSSGRLTSEEQEEAVKLILQVVLVAGIILLAKIVKTEKAD